MLDFIRICFYIGLASISPFIAIGIFSTLDKIGWEKVGTIFLICCIIIAMMIFEPKAKPTEEEKRHNERMEKIRQELSRPIIQAELEKRANDKNYNPLFPNRKEKEVTLSDVVGSFFDVIRAVIPTKDNPIKADITYTTPKGEDLKINVEIRDKSQK